jgi:hypothetical protein
MLATGKERSCEKLFGLLEMFEGETHHESRNLLVVVCDGSIMPPHAILNTDKNKSA